jgi:hypothetical protein
MEKNFVYGSMQKMKSFLLANMKLQSKEVTKSWKLSASLNQISTKQLIDLLVTNDGTILITKGKPSIEEIEAAVNAIKDEFNEVSGGEDVAHNINQLKEITRLSFKIERGYSLLDVLNISLNEKLFNQIYTYTYPIPKQSYNVDSAKHTLKIFESYLKLDYVELQSKIKELPKSEGKFNYTMQYFYSLIASIEQGLKISINENECNAYKFAVYISNYKTYQKYLETEINNTKK